MTKPIIFTSVVVSLIFLLISCQEAPTKKNLLFENLLATEDINKSIEIYATYFNGFLEIQLYNRSTNQFQMSPYKDLEIFLFETNLSSWEEIPISSITIVPIQQLSLMQTPSKNANDFQTILDQNITVDENTIVTVEPIQDNSISVAFFVIPQENSMPSISEIRVLITANESETSSVAGAYFDVMINP